MRHYYPTFEDFCELAEQGNTIPVYRHLLADALTPVSAYQRLAMPAGQPPASHAFLLESVVGGEQIARYSFVGVDPELTFTATRVDIVITPRGGQARRRGALRTSARTTTPAGRRPPAPGSRRS